MAIHFSGKSARSLPQNPMQRPTVLTVSQSDSKLFPLGSGLCVVHDWKETLGGFSPVISFSCIFCSPSILRQLFFNHLCLCSYLSPFSSPFMVSILQFPFFCMLFGLDQSLHISLPFLLHLYLLPVLLPFFLQ